MPSEDEESKLSQGKFFPITAIPNNNKKVFREISVSEDRSREVRRTKDVGGAGTVRTDNG